jgi:hypothetical protein
MAAEMLGRPVSGAAESTDEVFDRAGGRRASLLAEQPQAVLALQLSTSLRKPVGRALRNQLAQLREEVLEAARRDELEQQEFSTSGHRSRTRLR